MKTLDQMIELNRTQAEFYDRIQEAEVQAESHGYAENENANIITRTYAKLRYQQQRAVGTTEINDRVRKLHLEWIASKTGGNFLEIGCFNGSHYTFDLIKAAGNYTGIELSSAACASLREKIEARDLSGKASVVCGDFLAFEPGHKFDFIYAHGVLHHFENAGLLFAKIRELLTDDGALVFVEPIAINPVFRFLRSLYRPFQSDAAWEWPFSKDTVAELSKRFEVADGLGWGRFSAPLTLACGIPGIGAIALPTYQWVVRREISTPLQDSYWHNSMVATKCLPKAVST